jgi:hypothetical protein
VVVFVLEMEVEGEREGEGGEGGVVVEIEFELGGWMRGVIAMLCLKDVEGWKDWGDGWGEGDGEMERWRDGEMEG